MPQRANPPGKSHHKGLHLHRPRLAGAVPGRRADLSYQRPDYEIFDYPGRFKDEQHGADFAKYQMDGWRNNVDFASGTSNCPQLQPGRWFTLTDHPREDLNSPWQVVSSEMTGSQPQAQIGSAGQGTTLTNSFHVIPATQTWRPAPLPKPRWTARKSALSPVRPGRNLLRRARARDSEICLGPL
ncbi:contractile injection system protein, VgrG/Pvc8 family [Buttiauxella agrestis]